MQMILSIGAEKPTREFHGRHGRNGRAGQSLMQAKKRTGFPNSLYGNNQLNQLVIDFYKINFWQKIGGDFLADQDIADIFVDAAVNEGIKAAVKRAQKIVHLPEIGIIDNELLKRLNVLI
jgi:hypothetical protein